MRNQGISNLEIIIDTSPNYIAAYLTYHFENKNNKAGYTDNIRSGIKSYFKRNAYVKDYWHYDLIKKCHVGKLYGSIIVKETESSSDNVSKDRGD